MLFYNINISKYLLLQVPVYGTFRGAFNNIRSAIVEKLDVSHGLVDLLLQRGILLDSHVADIRVSVVLLNAM